MTVIIPHHKTRAEAVSSIEKASSDLFSNGLGSKLQIVDPKKEWSDAATESVMTFSLTGRMGFISVPLSGTIAVDDSNVTVVCDLPNLIKNFVGEAKVKAGIESKMKQIVSA